MYQFIFVPTAVRLSNAILGVVLTTLLVVDAVAPSHNRKCVNAKVQRKYTETQAKVLTPLLTHSLP